MLLPIFSLITALFLLSMAFVNQMTESTLDENIFLAFIRPPPPSTLPPLGSSPKIFTTPFINQKKKNPVNRLYETVCTNFARVCLVCGCKFVIMLFMVEKILLENVCFSYNLTAFDIKYILFTYPALFSI